MSRTVEFPPSIWAAVTPERPLSPPLEGAARTDVAVIGAGFSGLSTALELARRGHEVTVLEGRAVGWGASGRNNGQVIPTMSAVEPEAIAARYGEPGERFVRLIARSAEVLFRLVEEEGIECEAEQTGWFQPAHSPGRIRLSEKRVKAWQRFGAPAELLDREACRRLLGSDFWHGGMLNPTGGHINPLALARGLADACLRRGVILHEASPVKGIARKGDGWRVEAGRGTLDARAVVLATNAYTDALVPHLAPRISRTIVPILSWQMATEPLGENLRRVILPGRQAVSDTRGDLRFFRYDARHRLITGGAVLGPWRAAGRVRDLVAGRMAEAFPELGRPEISHVWSGRVGITRDRFPHLHRLGPDFWAWTGCNGRGVALSVSLGRELAGLVAGGALADLRVPVSEPDPIPLHGIVRHVAPVALAWYRRRDLVEPKLD